MRGFRGWPILLTLVVIVCTASHPPAEPTAPANPVTLNNLGVAYMNQQRFEQALELFQRAYKLSPDLRTARLNQGIALLYLQRYEEARQILLEATRQQPGNPRAWYNLGLLSRNLGQAQQAVEAFQQVLQLDPKDADTHYFLGLLHTQLQTYKAAVASLEQALALNPFHVSAEFGLARVNQRMGQSEKARQHLARFQQLTQEKLGAPMGLAYGEQGQYSLVEQLMPAGGLVPPAIPVRFLPVASQVGLDFVHGGRRPLEAGPPESAQRTENLAIFLGSGACFLDYNGDGRADLFVVNSGDGAASELYRNEGEGRFRRTTGGAQLEIRGYGLGCTAADYDNDGWMDLAVSFLDRVAIYRNQGDGTFRDVTQSAGLRADGLGLGITFVDYDHDGDLDLYLPRFVVSQPDPDQPAPFEFPFVALPITNASWRNNGNGTFSDTTEATGLTGAAPTVAAAATDFNNDRAIDLVLTGWQRAPVIFLNAREGPFRPVEPWATPMPAATAGAAVFDFDKDGWMDLAFTHWAAPGLTLWRNREGKRMEQVPLPPLNWRRGWGVATLDYDNDGWLDLAALGETTAEGEIRLFRNRGPDGFEEVTAAVGLEALKLRRPRALITADYDGDGDRDLLATQNGGPVVLLRNDGGNQNMWLRVSLQGRADNRSAIGTKLEVFAGTLYQKWEVTAASGYLGQSALEITAGLAQTAETEIVRLLWPTGVFQDEVQLAVQQAHTVSEIDRRGSSCPVLFVWNGYRYEFIADAIGPGIVGHWVGPGQRNTPDPTEYVKVEGARAQPRQGRLSFRFLEPMEEVVYLDQVRLVAVDHPADARVFPNEYFASQPPFPTFKVVASQRAQPPVGAWDGRGRDVLEELRRRDRRYVAGFGLLPFKGFAELHTLELDLGDWDPAQPLRLLMHGFTDYFTATSVFAAYQAGVRPVPPYVEALTPSGRWVRVLADMGFPAGLARTMVADLTGHLPPDTRRIRVITNLQIYWDEILVDNTAEPVPVRLTEVPLAAAELSFVGYPRVVDGSPPGDLTYVYQEVSPTGPYALHAGNYTRYGEVQMLLAESDDQFVVLGSGEEVALEFDPAGLPPLAAEWTRDYFFFADGFAKDMDFYEAHSLTVEPLPFHAMDSYPYLTGKGYPGGEVHLGYQLTYNTRPVSGKQASSLRFQYAGR